MKNNRFLKFGLSITTILIIFSILSNLLPEKEKNEQKYLTLQLQQRDSNKIKKLIKEGKLSDKEALFYEVINLK